MSYEIAFGFFRIGSEWFLKIGSDRIRTGSFRIGSDRIRILKFTNYRIGNFQSDPMHTFSSDLRLLPQGRGVARAKREVRAQLDNLKMANFRNKEREEIVREVLSIQPILIGSFFTLMILSCLLFR